MGKNTEDTIGPATVPIKIKVDTAGIYPTPTGPKPVQDVTPEELAAIARPLAFRLPSLLVLAVIFLTIGVWNTFGYLTTGFFYLDTADLKTTSHDFWYYAVHLSWLCVGLYLLLGKRRGLILFILYTVAFIGGAYIFFSIWAGPYAVGASLASGLLIMATIGLIIYTMGKIRALVD